MKKAYRGVRLRRLREERGLTQQALAAAIGVSPSYLNQIENDRRPLTDAVLLKLGTTFGVDLPSFSDDAAARLLAELRAVLSDASLGETVTAAELRTLAGSMPAVARTLIALHQRYGRALEQTAVLASRLGDDRGGGAIPVSTPFEAVRDFFYARRNHVAELDDAAERIAVEARLPVGAMAPVLAERLWSRHGVHVADGPGPGGGDAQRRFDPAGRTLHLSPQLGAGQRAFQMATQLAFLEQHDMIAALVDGGGFAGEESRRLARIGLANYFAGALMMPYEAFRMAAEACRYDIDLLGQRFGVGFETTCHRLSTLQRPGAQGVPFFFIRVDRAGNISKRQSATDFHFSRIGGTCPLWNVYEAFVQPGRVLRQLAQMPDGRTYLWVARSVTQRRGGYHALDKTFSVALGCDVRHAGRLVYSDGLDLASPAAATPIGAGCKICERPDCPQRAFPPVGRDLRVDENRSAFAPYGAG